MSGADQRIVALALKRDEIEKLLDEFERAKKRYEEIPYEVLTLWKSFAELATKCGGDAALSTSIELAQRIKKVSASFGTNRSASVV
jgi:hypothetical protein